MYKKKWYFPILMFCCLASVYAQETNDLKKFPAQISIVYPIGTHGRQSINHAYNLSLNLFTGKVGRLNGLEINGLFGFCVGIAGIQTGGLGNVAGIVQGIQVGGLFNLSEDLKGIQTGGLVNHSNSVKGLQIGGFGNNTTYEAKGIQIGGFGNRSCSGVRGMQLAGICNSSSKVTGLQISGIYNLTDYCPTAGVTGIQISGIYNIGNTMTGMQIGAYNRVQTLRGIQIGIFSVNDTIEKGGSLSLVNIVKKGYYKEWELLFSDYANVALSYKMGVQKFYTIYTAGVNFIGDNLWIAGIGFGNRTSIGNRFDFQPELVSFNYFPTNFKNTENTFTTRLKFGFVYRLNEKYGLLSAPSVYFMNTKKIVSVGISLGLSIR